MWERKDFSLFLCNVPVGFSTDGASVPRPFWNLFSPLDTGYFEAALIHDFLYASHELKKKDADLVFYETMVTLKTPPWKREILFYGVKVFGQKSYETGPERWEKRKNMVRTLLLRQ